MLILSTIDASVVDLPEPVGPVTRIKTARFFTHIRNDRRKPECVERFDLVRNRTKNRADRAFLIEKIGTKTRHSLQTERKVEFEIFFKTMLLRVGQNRIGELFRFDGRQRAITVKRS